MDRQTAQMINDQLFNLQFENNGLYGYFITYRFVTTNDLFQVKVFHEGDASKVINIRNLSDVDKIRNLFDK